MLGKHDLPSIRGRGEPEFQRREARGERREARSEKREARSEKREARARNRKPGLGVWGCVALHFELKFASS